MYKHLLEKEVLTNFSDHPLVVVGIDHARGITLESIGGSKTCINGKLSNHPITPKYEECFKYMTDAIEYGYYDSDVLDAIITGIVQDWAKKGKIDCAFI